MKLLLLLILTLLLTGCAETHVKWHPNGKLRSFVIAGDAERVHFANRGPNVTLDIDRLNHTAPTDARGRNITRGGNAATSVVTAATAHALIP